MASESNQINTAGMNQADLAIVEALQAEASGGTIYDQPSPEMDVDMESPEGSRLTPDSAQDIRLALGGRKRGRPIGSGRGQKRKAADEYSTNPHTVKARQRYEAMGPHQRAVHAADTADRTAISRTTKILTKSTMFQSLPLEEKKEAIKAAKAQVLDARFRVGYNADLVKTELQAMLEDTQLEEEDFLYRQKLLGNTDDNADDYWAECDDFEPKELKTHLKEVEEYIGDDTDMLNSVMDMAYDKVKINESKRTLTAPETKMALDQMAIRQGAGYAARASKEFAFYFWKDEFHARIARLRKELKALDKISVETAMATLPHQVISKQSRGLLRCVWSFYSGRNKDPDSDWISLPGPPELWPEDETYYVRYGFEVAPHFAERHRKALHLIGAKKAPTGWMEEVVHEESRYELIWYRGFQPL